MKRKKAISSIGQAGQTYRSYKGIRTEAHKLVRRTKTEYRKSYTKKLEPDFYGQQKQIWRFVRQQRTKMKELIEYTHLKKEMWVTYLTQLYKRE